MSIGRDLESVAIVVVKEGRDQVTDGMVSKIVAQIPDVQPGGARSGLGMRKSGLQ